MPHDHQGPAAPSAGPPLAAGDDDAEATDSDLGRLARWQRVLIWLAVPAVITLGAGAGYLAAGQRATSEPQSAASATHDGHTPVPSAGHQHGTDAVSHPAEHAGHDSAAPESDPEADDHASPGHGAADHSAPGSANAGHVDTDHGQGAAAVTGSAPGDAGGHGTGGGHGAAGHGASGSSSRPRTAVLTAFAAVNAAIIIGAALVRRRTARSPRPTRPDTIQPA
ncbi:hypothetical protein GCM10009682_28000 [Luedemannella flava]|uniref:Uncharacterized protein n=1 Tax=Luedemannella flava TaxID=349316 RepID=A0ABP4Y5S7_9ACTN